MVRYVSNCCMLLPFSHLNPVIPDGQEQLPSTQVPPFKQEKSLGQAEEQNKWYLHDKKSTTLVDIIHLKQRFSTKNGYVLNTISTSSTISFLMSIWTTTVIVFRAPLFACAPVTCIASAGARVYKIFFDI